MTALFFRDIGDTDFGSILERARQITAPLDRAKDVKGVTYRIDQIALEGELFSADVVRVRDTFGPGRMRLDVEGVSDLGFDEGEYLGEETALIYQRDLRLLVLQTNRFGISSLGLPLYMRALFADVLPTFAVIFEDQELATQLKRFNRVNHFEIEVASASPTQLSRMGFSGGSLANMMGKHDASKLKLVLKAERGGTLSYVKELAKSVLDIRAQDEGGKSQMVRAARLMGTTENGHATVLDLLQDKMMERVDLQFREDVTRVPYVARMAGLKQALKRRKDSPVLALPDPE